MTASEDVTKKKAEPTADAAMTAELMCLTKEQGVSLTESGRAPETVHQNRPQNRVERGDHQAHHIGHDKNPRQIGTRRTSFGGTRPTTVLTEARASVHVPIDTRDLRTPCTVLISGTIPMVHGVNHPPGHGRSR